MLDGWTDASNRSIYAVMFCCPDFDVFLGVLDLTLKRHTATNIRVALVDLFKKLGIPFRKAVGICTDSPSTMVKFRKDLILVDGFSWLISIPCSLHVLNNLIKDICKDEKVAPVVSANSKLTSFFTSSHFWLESARSWMKENNIKKGLTTLARTRWYSMSQVCLCVNSFKSFFFSAMLKSNDRGEDSPSINHAVQDCISSRHFNLNSQLVDVIKPISDAIGRLECQESTVVDTMIEIFKIAKKIRTLPESNPFKECAILALAKRARIFDDVTNFLILFLSPKHKAFAIAKKYSLEDLKRRMFEIAREWKWKKNEVMILNVELSNYISNQHCFALIPTIIHDVLDFWKRMELQAPYLARFAKLLLALRPHAARIEGLFSSLSLIHSKARNRLHASNLVNLGRVKLVLQSQVNDLKQEYSRSDVGVQRLRKAKKKRKTDCNEDLSDDDNLFASEENENETFVVDFIENELEELDNHEGLVGTGEDDLKILDGLFDYLNFNDDGFIHEVEEVDEDGEDVIECETNDDEENWDIEDLLNSSY